MEIHERVDDTLGRLSAGGVVEIHQGPTAYCLLETGEILADLLDRKGRYHDR
jgi:hypothetical protein